MCLMAMIIIITVVKCGQNGRLSVKNLNDVKNKQKRPTCIIKVFTKIHSAVLLCHK